MQTVSLTINRIAPEIKEKYLNICDAAGLSTKEMFIKIVENYENTGNTDNSGKISDLENKILNLKAEISELNNEIENRPTPETPEPHEIIKEIPAQLKENQILVETNFKEFFALEVTQSAIFEAKGAKKTKADILRNLFIQYFSEGVGDWLPISDKHRRNWVNMIKTETEKQQK